MKDCSKQDRWMQALREKAEKLATEALQTPVATEASDLRVLLHELSVYHIELEMQNRELREAQELLDLSRKKYYELFNLAPVGFMTLTKDGRILEANLTTCDLLETDLSEIKNKPFVFYVSPEAHPTLYEHLSHVARSRTRGSVSLVLRQRSGHELIVRLETVSIFDPDGSFRQFLVTMTNITDLVQTHKQLAQKTEQLKASERALRIRNDLANVFLTSSEKETLPALLRLVVAELSCRMAVMAVQEDGNFLATSVEFGPWEGEFCKAPSVSLYCGNLCRRWWKEAQERFQPWIIFRAEHQDLQEVEENLLVAPIHFQKHFLGVLIAGGHDRTLNQEDLRTITIITDYLAPLLHARVEKQKHEAERRRLEEEQRLLEKQLREAQKMEAIGRLAGGVAHDFNNSLQVILGRLDLLMDTITPHHPAYVHAEEIQRAGIKSTELVRQLLTFARGQVFKPRRVHLNEAIESILKMLRRLIGENIELIWKPGPELWSVRIDPVHVDQILANLCVNARDAIDGFGRIVVETSNVTLPSNMPNPPSDFKPGDYVLLSVTDTGCGMDSSTMMSIFDPFFTTKEMGKGTGLGLSIVYGIVKQNKGLISVESEKGQGTTFKIFLPRNMENDEAVPSEKPKELPKSAGETVLVVEDDPANLTMTGAILERLGYKVLVASHPAEALKIAAKHRESIHLLLTDLIMPYMDGKTLAKKIQKLRPDIKILFMSGYASEHLAGLSSNLSEVMLLSKPFSREELAQRVRLALDYPG